MKKDRSGEQREKEWVVSLWLECLFSWNDTTDEMAGISLFNLSLEETNAGQALCKERAGNNYSRSKIPGDTRIPNEKQQLNSVMDYLHSTGTQSPSYLSAESPSGEEVRLMTAHPVQYVVLVREGPITQVTYGPFPNFDQAVDWANTVIETSKHWDVIPLYYPVVH